MITRPLLLGTHNPKLDDKGRLIIPAKFRDIFASGLVIARGQEKCLYLLPAAEFERMYSQIEAAPLTDKQARDYLRVFLSSASDEQPDKQGRVLVPAGLREYAGLNREVVVIGTGTRAELWDKEAWEEYLDSKLEDYSNLDSLEIAGAANGSGVQK